MIQSGPTTIFGISTFIAWCALTIFTPDASAKALFKFLDYNQKWYRTFDDSSSILPKKGQLLFSWKLVDDDQKPDSFYIGINSLWSPPKNVNGNPDKDWDLQVCPDGFCIQGLILAQLCNCDGSTPACPNGYCVAGVKQSGFGGNSNFPFGNFVYSAEHHFQFVGPVDDQTFFNIAPEKSLFGGYLFAKSRSTGHADTVLGFGAWRLNFDENNPPPVRPVNGYLPKFTDFTIEGNTVRYQGPTSTQEKKKAETGDFRLQSTLFTNQVEILLPRGQKILYILDVRGKKVFQASLSPWTRRMVWLGHDDKGNATTTGTYFFLLQIDGNIFKQKAIKISGDR